MSGTRHIYAKSTIPRRILYSYLYDAELSFKLYFTFSRASCSFYFSELKFYECLEYNLFPVLTSRICTFFLFTSFLIDLIIIGFESSSTCTTKKRVIMLNINLFFLSGRTCYEAESKISSLSLHYQV